MLFLFTDQTILKIKEKQTIFLFYSNVAKSTISNSGLKRNLCLNDKFYSKIFVTTPAPTVRPPSRIAKRIPFSTATG